MCGLCSLCSAPDAEVLPPARPSSGWWQLPRKGTFSSRRCPRELFAHHEDWEKDCGRPHSAHQWRGVRGTPAVPVSTSEEVNWLSSDAAGAIGGRWTPPSSAHCSRPIIDPEQTVATGRALHPPRGHSGRRGTWCPAPRAEWEALRASLKPLLAEIEEARRQQGNGLYAEGALGQTQTERAVGLLTAFQDRLAAVQMLDPAMGSGNFLYVTVPLAGPGSRGRETHFSHRDRECAARAQGQPDKCWEWKSTRMPTKSRAWCCGSGTSSGCVNTTSPSKSLLCWTGCGPAASGRGV